MYGRIHIGLSKVDGWFRKGPPQAFNLIRPLYISTVGEFRCTISIMQQKHQNVLFIIEWQIIQSAPDIKFSKVQTQLSFEGTFFLKSVYQKVKNRRGSKVVFFLGYLVIFSSSYIASAKYQILGKMKIIN